MNTTHGAYDDEPLMDAWGRTVTYLRISVTDLCNFRCVYCMPEQGIEKCDHAQILSFEEILEIAEACVSMGVDKIRLTGGEPLVRRGILELCCRLKQLPGLRELALTTNASMLSARISRMAAIMMLRHKEPLPLSNGGVHRYYTDDEAARPVILAQCLKEAGVDRLNISLDTLREDRFREISRVGELSDVWRGIIAARKAGFSSLKFNVVLMGGVNDDEIPDFVELTRDKDWMVRFIELMPVDETAAWDRARFLSADTVLARCPRLVPCGDDGVSRLYHVPGYQGNVGLIRTMSEPFCASCNRMRLTADGMLKPCLHRGLEMPLRGLHGEALKAAIRKTVAEKPANCGIADTHKSESGRGMYAIGG